MQYYITKGDEAPPGNSKVTFTRVPAQWKSSGNARMPYHRNHSINYQITSIPVATKTDWSTWLLAAQHIVRHQHWGWPIWSTIFSGSTTLFAIDTLQLYRSSNDSNLLINSPKNHKSDHNTISHHINPAMIIQKRKYTTYTSTHACETNHVILNAAAK